MTRSVRTAGFSAVTARIRFFILFACAFLVVPISAASAATEPEKKPQDLFADSVRVDVVNIETFVTDKDGQPVLGLTESDFEVSVEGDPVAITNFRAPVPVDLEVHNVLSEVEEEVEASVPSYLVVFIDLSNRQPTRSDSVTEAVRALVEERLQRGDHIMIAAYDSRVEVLSSFDDDAEAHLAAIQTADRTSASTFETLSEYRKILRCIEVTCSTQELVRQDIDVYAREIRSRARVMLAHLASLVETTAALPGRRSMVIVSDGIPVRPAESLYAVWNATFLGAQSSTRSRVEANRFRLDRDLGELTELANARRVTLYSLNSGGVVGSSLAQSSVSMTASQMTPTEIDYLRDANHSASMQRMAGDTGGQVVFNTTADTVDTVSVDLDAAYSLGFQPDHGPDDRSRKIKVRVLKDGLKVRHREAYRLTTDEGAAAVQTRLALVLGEVSNPLGIAAEFDAEARKAGRRRIVAVAVKVPMNSITLVPMSDGLSHGKLDFVFQLEDEEGQSTPLLESELPLEIPAEALNSPTPLHITYDVGLKVRPGDHRIAMTVTDVPGTRASTLTWNVSVDSEGRVVVSDR